MPAKSFILLFLVSLTIFLTLSSKVQTIDNDDFQLYNEKEDDGFEETTLEMSEYENKPIEAENPETPQDDTSISPDSTPITQEAPSAPISDPESISTPNDESENLSQNQNPETESSDSSFTETQPEILQTPNPKPQTPKTIQTPSSSPSPVDKFQSSEMRVIVCLAMYSKSASNSQSFQSKLESKFSTALITSDNIKSKLVEKYVVNAVHQCTLKLDGYTQENVREMMVSLYKDDMSSEIVSAHIVYDDEILVNPDAELTEDEVKISEQMKEVQKKHGQGKEEVRSASLTEIYGEYLFLIMLIIGGAIVMYMCMSVKGKGKGEEGEIQGKINEMKKERRNMIVREKKLVKEIEEVKGQINAAKKSK